MKSVKGYNNKNIPYATVSLYKLAVIPLAEVMEPSNQFGHCNNITGFDPQFIIKQCKSDGWKWMQV